MNSLFFSGWQPQNGNFSISLYISCRVWEYFGLCSNFSIYCNRLVNGLGRLAAVSTSSDVMTNMIYNATVQWPSCRSCRSRATPSCWVGIKDGIFWSIPRKKMHNRTIGFFLKRRKAKIRCRAGDIRNEELRHLIRVFYANYAFKMWKVSKQVERSVAYMFTTVQTLQLCSTKK